MSMEHLTDREISWLSFDQRVLELAEDESTPTLERLRFLAIASSNLDEFFMVRVATLMSKIENNVSAPNVAGHRPKELLALISTKVNELVSRQTSALHDSILPSLKQQGIEFVTWQDLDETESNYVAKLFQDRIFPVLTPLAVDPTHPFPYISGLSLNLAVIVKNPNTHEEFFARVKVPEVLPRFIATAKSGSTRFLPLEDLIAIHLQELFPGMIIEDHYTFRVTRNQDIELEDEETEDLLLTLEQELLRRRFGPPVRLEIEAGVDEKLVQQLGQQLGIGEENIFHIQAPLNLTSLHKIADLDFPELKFTPFRSRTAKALSEVETDDFDISDYLQDDVAEYKTRANNQSKDSDDKVIPFSGGTTFRERLNEQLQLLKLAEGQELIANILIGNLDESGYLNRDLEAIVDDLAFSMNVHVNEGQVLEVLKMIQDLDPAEGPFLVVDIGGGSTEFVFGTSSVEAARSVNIGCVRMSERHFTGDLPDPGQVAAATEDIDEAIADAAYIVPIKEAKTLIAVAGTATTVAAAALGLSEYDRHAIHLSRIPAAKVIEIAQMFSLMSREEIAALGYMHPGRVDVIAAGSLVLSRVMLATGATEFVASESDILDGMAWALD